MNGSSFFPKEAVRKDTLCPFPGALITWCLFRVSTSSKRQKIRNVSVSRDHASHLTALFVWNMVSQSLKLYCRGELCSLSSIRTARITFDYIFFLCVWRAQSFLPAEKPLRSGLRKVLPPPLSFCMYFCILSHSVLSRKKLLSELCAHVSPPFTPSPPPKK